MSIPQVKRKLERTSDQVGFSKYLLHSQKPEESLMALYYCNKERKVCLLMRTLLLYMYNYPAATAIHCVQTRTSFKIPICSRSSSFVIPVMNLAWVE